MVTDDEAASEGGHVSFGPKADIRSVWTYRTDCASKVFYKQTPYRPVFSRIFLRACKTLQQ